MHGTGSSLKARLLCIEGTGVFIRFAWLKKYHLQRQDEVERERDKLWEKRSNEVGAGGDCLSLERLLFLPSICLVYV